MEKMEAEKMTDDMLSVAEPSGIPEAKPKPKAVLFYLPLKEYARVKGLKGRRSWRECINEWADTQEAREDEKAQAYDSEPEPEEPEDGL